MVLTPRASVTPYQVLFEVLKCYDGTEYPRWFIDDIFDQVGLHAEAFETFLQKHSSNLPEGYTSVMSGRARLYPWKATHILSACLTLGGKWYVCCLERDMTYFVLTQQRGTVSLTTATRLIACHSFYVTD